MNRPPPLLLLLFALFSFLPLATPIQAADADSRTPFLDRRLILPVDGFTERAPNMTPEVWLAWNRLLRGVLSNSCIVSEPERGQTSPESSRTDAPSSKPFILRWIDFFNETSVPLTNLTVLARFSIDFNAGTVEPIPSLSPISDAEALSIVTNRFPDAIGVEGTPPLVQHAGGITIVGIPAIPDSRTRGRHYIYDPIVWIHDESKNIFEFCSQESEIPFPHPVEAPSLGQTNLNSGSRGGVIWDAGGLTVVHETK